LPIRIIRSAPPSTHSAAEHLRNNRHQHHPKGLSLNMWSGIQRYLPALKCRGIAADLCGECMRSLVTSGGKQESQVPENANRNNITREFSHCLLG
jgi:hypothetical protein